MTILVAGDQRLRDLLLHSLAQKGYTLVFVQSGEEFATLVRTLPIDLVIMDMDTVARSSFSTLAELKRVLESLSVPVVVAAESAGVTPDLEELRRLLRQNSAAVLNRPLDLKQLEQEVARILGDEFPRTDCLTEQTLSRLTDGELSEKEADRAQDHLSECDTCERRFEEWKRTDSLFRDSFETVMMTRMHSSTDCISPKRLTAYFRDGLPAAERAEVEAHLSRCSFCTRELVALYRLMKDFDEKELEPLGEEILNRLKSSMRELLRKARGPLICIHCVGSIPLGSDSCPQCGAVVRGKAQEKKLPAEGKTANGRDEEERATRPNGGYIGTRRIQVAASLLGLALMASAVLAGIAIHQNRELSRSARTVIDGSDLFSQTGEDSSIARLLKDQIEEEIEVFGQIAMCEPRTARFEVPEHVRQIARALIAEQYYDASIAARALQHDDIWHAFATLNRLETKGSGATLLPRSRNGILEPDGLRVLREELSGDFTGIGATFRVSAARDGGEITGFTPNSPAKQSGLQVGDVITEIDATHLRELDLAQMTVLGRGPVGTIAKLKVAREDVPEFEVKILREKSSIPALVEHSLVGAGTAYFEVRALLGGAKEALRTFLPQLTEAGVRRLILDLRGNTGGSVEIAKRLCELFLPEGASVVTLKQRASETRFYAEGGPIWQGQLAILVDRYTLSAGELIAAVLKDAEIAVVLGERTAGKGSVQTIYRLADNYAVQMTTGVLASPSGLIIDNRGVEPDIEVLATGEDKMARRYGKILNDGFIQAALEVLGS